MSMDPPALGAMMRYFATLKAGAASKSGIPTGTRMDPYSEVVPLLPDQYAYVLNYCESRLLHPMGFERVLGYPDDQVDMEFVFRYIHPDDLPAVTRIVERTIRSMYDQRTPTTPFATFMSLDYRVRKANGSYLKILRQTAVCEVEPITNTMLSTLSICKDISNIKQSNKIGWQGLGPGLDEMDMRDILSENGNLVYRPSAREMDVIRKMADGCSSARIADELNISLHTVNTHRKNLLQRTGLPNAMALVALAKEQGWV